MIVVQVIKADECCINLIVVTVLNVLLIMIYRTILEVILKNQQYFS